jgi:hypothetical protein
MCVKRKDNACVVAYVRENMGPVYRVWRLHRVPFFPAESRIVAVAPHAGRKLSLGRVPSRRLLDRWFQSG